MSPQPKEKAIKREKRAVEEQDDEEKEEATNDAVDDENKQPPKKRKRESNGDDTEDVWDLVWPCRHGVVGNPGECTVLLQIDPEDAANIDLHGAAGAVGRLEVDAEGVILDMKGRQYHGRIFPGPTALVLGTQPVPVAKSAASTDDADTPQLKVLGITDEFVRCLHQGDGLETA